MYFYFNNPLCDFFSYPEMAKSISYVISVLDIVGCQSYVAIYRCTKKREEVSYDTFDVVFFKTHTNYVFQQYINIAKV